MLTKQFARLVKSIDREKDVKELFALRTKLLQLKKAGTLSRQNYFELSDVVFYRLKELKNLRNRYA